MALFAAVPIMLAWMCVFVWSLITAAAVLRWKRPIMAAVPPLIPLILFVASYWAIPHVLDAQDYMYYRTMRYEYDVEVSRLPKDGHRFAEFNWGGMLFASKGVVYDETDEVGLPYGHQSANWKRRMRNTDLTCGGDGPVGEVLSLGQHYYMVGFGC